MRLLGDGLIAGGTDLVDETQMTSLEDLPVAVAVVDAAGDVVWCNAAARDRLGGAASHMTLAALRARALEDPGRFHLRSAPGHTEAGVEFTWVVIGEARDDHEMLTAFAHQALHDSLTGLPNRTLLDDRLHQALARASRPGHHVSVMFLDLDHFKLINDTQGHATGDALLRAIAERLLEAVRPGDTVARFGGDEFVVVCEDVADETEAHEIAQRLCEAIELPLRVQRDEVFITASLGVAVSRSTDTTEDLLRDADAAMYQAKVNGRARAELFDAQIRARAEHRRDTENALRRAVEEQQFRLVYQPIIDLEAGWVVGAEALLRWDHPERGIVSPVDFIGVAEETGLIQPIGAWVLDEACQQLQRWRSELPHVPLFMAVNISARQLRTGIADQVRAALSRHHVSPGCLTLEITEGVLMEDIARCEDALNQLHADGIRLAIDDFGIGYSSLNYLKQFPIDVIKIDRAFVDGLGTCPNDTAIVSAIVGMARALKINLVAEGVETPTQLRALRHLGCQQAQGFHLAKPMPPDDVTKLLAASQRW